MKTKYRHVFDEIKVYSRWKWKHCSRDCNWVIFGISKRWFSSSEYSYALHLFGIDIKIWFKLVKHV